MNSHAGLAFLGQPKELRDFPVEPVRRYTAVTLLQCAHAGNLVDLPADNDRHDEQRPKQCGHSGLPLTPAPELGAEVCWHESALAAGFRTNRGRAAAGISTTSNFNPEYLRKR